MQKYHHIGRVITHFDVRDISPLQFATKIKIDPIKKKGRKDKVIILFNEESVYYRRRLTEASFYQVFGLKEGDVIRGRVYSQFGPLLASKTALFSLYTDMTVVLFVCGSLLSLMRIQRLFRIKC